MTTARSDFPAQPPVATGTVAAAPPRALAAVADAALRVIGGVMAVLLAAVTAILEIFYVPLRLGGVPIGASVVAAVLINYWLLRYTIAVTGTGWSGLLPPLVWFGLMATAATRTAEGDVLLAADEGMGLWVGLATIFAGSLAFAVSGYRVLLQPSSTAAGPLL